MNLTENEKQTLRSSALQIVISIKNDPDFLGCNVLKDYVEQYLKFIEAINENRIKDSKSIFLKVSSFSRAYFEVNSDWKKPFLMKMYNFEELGKSVYLQNGK